jgi:hypothetical protein
MLLYRAFGVTIGSRFNLPSLASVVTDRTDVAVTIEPSGPSAPTVSRWLREWRLGRERPRVAFGLASEGYVCRFDRATEFVISESGSVIRAPHPATDADAPIEHLLLDQVVPLALAQQGHLLLHASAVHVPGVGALAILGRSRRGKSTLASALARHAVVLADDCVRVDHHSSQFQAVPSYPGLRLWSDAGRKIRFNGKAAPFQTVGSRLRGIFVLGTRATRGPAVAVRVIPGPQALVQLARHQFQLDVTDRTWLAHSFGMLTALAASVPVYRLRVRDGLDVVDDAATGLVEQMLAS